MNIGTWILILSGTCMQCTDRMQLLWIELATKARPPLGPLLVSKQAMLYEIRIRAEQSFAVPQPIVMAGPLELPVPAPKLKQLPHTAYANAGISDLRGARYLHCHGTGTQVHCYPSSGSAAP